MRILIIDDDILMAESIQLMLESAGMVCNVANSGEDGLDFANLYEFDLIILDILMPDINGYKVLKKLRDENISTPVLMLSGLDEAEQKVKGFETGADDYLTKPFKKEELIARINAIVRRTKGFSGSTIDIGNMKINLSNKIVTIDNTEIHLTKKEYGILELLSLRKGSVLSKEVFLNHLYNGLDEPELKIIDVFVCKLRKKLEEISGGHNYIETVWGRGYMLKEPNPATKQSKNM